MNRDVGKRFFTIGRKTSCLHIYKTWDLRNNALQCHNFPNLTNSNVNTAHTAVHWCLGGWQKSIYQEHKFRLGLRGTYIS